MKGLAFPLRSLHVHSVDHLVVKHQICESRVHLVKFLVHGFDKCTVNCLWSFVFLRSRLVLAVHTVQARHARALSQKLF